ncbi:putative phosphoenolpyruvate synthase isoform X2 [Argiope bruennichi]|uniref:putative phosphoenolpyruvate synthase isoform X2 n=1 Tax=Argiope bruennichi TaxID=94029 RepID=UPI002494422B|nr:putative phosphoenolpyruvate synthase isoform X2 [Argiope bruennichi]
MFSFTYWCKWITAYLYTSIFRRSLKPRFNSFDMDADGDPYKTDFLPYPEEITLESPLPESELISTVDEIFFYGVNSKSEYLITRIARGTNKEAEAWIYLRLANGKIYQLQESSGFQQSSSNKRTFSCGGLQIHYLKPMRRWRIFFNGLLKESSEDGTPSNKKVHVKFALIWRASTDPFDFRTDVKSKALTASLAKSEWKQYTPPLGKLFNALDFYAQCGIIMGKVYVDENEEFDMYLFGERLRFFGDVSSMEGMEFFHVLGHVCKNGRFIHVIEVSLPDVVDKLKFGFATLLTGGLLPLDGNDCILEKFVDENDVKAIIQAGVKFFQLKGTFTGIQNNFHNDEDRERYLTISCLDFELNSLSVKERKLLLGKEFNSFAEGQAGKGIVIKGKIRNISRKTFPKPSTFPSQSATALVVHFSEGICQNSDLTGGKGSSLGKLTELSKELQNFVVPNGIIVTTNAYELFVTDDILKEIRNLEYVLYRDKIDETKFACLALMEEVIIASIPDAVHQAIVMNLQNAFPDKKQDLKFAIRSSATGEDTEQMSAAGQMETYLGVSGISEIMNAIKKCWASQFSYIAVQYKRQNGQMINTPMAVVIQEMIPCDIAGVLFTCNPLTGNPLTMSISANYGLGESVVSGSEEPDTIEIERLDEDNLTIKNKIVGSKGHKIVLKDDGGIHTQDVVEQEKESCCLSDNMALQLGHLALKIEKSYGSHRDIEWGFWNNNLYIFQSRPVTTGAGETDFEIDHEFDGALRCENETFAVCNVGEVFPGATSPLGLDIILKYFKQVWESKRFLSSIPGQLPRYYAKGLVSMYRHIMFYCIDMLRHLSEDYSRAQSMALSFFGREVRDEELFEMVRERYSDGHEKILSKEMHLKILYRAFYGNKLRLKKLYETYKGYTLSSITYSSAQELFDHLLLNFSDLTLTMGSHSIMTEVACILNIAIFTILQKAYGEINSDVYNDFSKLLISSEVESADVPSAMESLAFSISKEIKSEDFKSMKIEDALQWLESSTTTAGEKYREFLRKHGHRCLREFDVYTLTWGSDQQPLVKLLQSLVGTVTKEKHEKKQEDLEQLISELKAPLTYTSKFFLKKILPLSRKAVQNREHSKSIHMRIVNEWRKECRNLAKMMVLEGRIPDEDLLFFMTLEEIKELFETRSPRIISKANHRRRRQPIIDRYIFPEVCKGFPKPVNADKKIVVNNDDNFSMKGIPVSQGQVTGVVRVALDLEEASLLKTGEILVTYCTDIGWTPYFPILGGVVTELGGLISHGAVVSREYGLPCVAGLHGATQQFKTGDYVLLDGNKGILQRLPKPEDL